MSTTSFSSLEVLHEKNVTIGRIQLGVEDCPPVRGDRQCRVLSGRPVLQIEHSRDPMGSEVEESNPGFRGRIEVINAVFEHYPIAPVSCFQRAYDLNLFAAVNRNAP